MKVLVDTSVWSLALRKKTLTEEEKKIKSELTDLIRELKVVIVGPIRQEILSGISNEEKASSLKRQLQAFDDLGLQQNDFEKAAEFSNTCRGNGIQGSHIDFLICAVAHNNRLKIFTTDKDFSRYDTILPIELYAIRAFTQKRNIDDEIT